MAINDGAPSAKGPHPFARGAEILLAFLLVLALVKLASVSALATLASELPQVSDWGGFITLTLPGLDKYGHIIVLILTGFVALSLGASRNPFGYPRVGVTTFALVLPCAALALAGWVATILVVVPAALFGLGVSAGRRFYVQRRVVNLVIWAVSAGCVYWVAVVFARA